MAASSLRVLDELARAFERRIPFVARDTAERARAEVEDWSTIDSPEVWEAIREITHRSRRTQADHLRRGLELPAACPPPDRDAAVLAVRAGIPLVPSIKSFRIGHAVAWGAWLEALEEVALEPEDERALLRRVSRFLIAYDDRVIDLFTRAYHDAERERRLHGGRELELIREILAGARDELPGVDYELGGTHLAVVGWGGRARLNLLRLARTLGRRPLIVEVSDEVWWAWLGARAAVGGSGLDAVRAFAPAGDCRLAVGGPGDAVAGFCRSHRQAGEARRVARHTGVEVTLYADVALEALGLLDERAAREFMTEQLAGLGGSDVRADQLKGTLRRYFASSQNAASTAAALGVHEQTVTRRIRAVEERIGCPVNKRRAELELALRLEDLLT